MVKTEHIVYDVAAAQKRFDELEWTFARWVEESGISELTIRKWLYGDPRVKFSTVASIVTPLGLNAMDLIRKNGSKKRA